MPSKGFYIETTRVDMFAFIVFFCLFLHLSAQVISFLQ